VGSEMCIRDSITDLGTEENAESIIHKYQKYVRG